MEALAAIGLASNILQFIDVGYKILKATKELRASGKEASRYNHGLEFVTGEMKRLGQSIEQDASASGMTNDEKALLRLSSECQQCSEELLALLEKLKNRRPSSVFHSLRAAFRDSRKQDEKARLEQNLDNLRKQMDIQLSKLARKETLEKLGSISASTEVIQGEIATTKKMVESIHKAMQASSGKSESHYHLQCILRISNDALIRSRRSAILSSLSRDRMNQRFLEVLKAHTATFEWLLLDPRREEPDSANKIKSDALNHEKGQKNAPWSPSPLRESENRFRHEANLTLNNWLRSGSGIFHISGKPGAGKSTLMKFICQSSKTLEYLGDWCGDDKLIVAKVFFWRQGQEDQRDLAGLIRSLLSQVLLACPELIPVAFPVQWAQTNENGLSARIEGDDIQEAFDHILCDAGVFKGRKFVFFIDALDEYSGRHMDLVDRLVTWSSQHPASLKIIVASREWNEFLVGFYQCPKLRLHDCTNQDITRFVNDKFDGLCRHLTLFSAEDMRELAGEIVKKAEGVFVWVRLVLNAVEDGVLNGDGISDLRVKVKTFPNELDDLYQYLFDSIPESYRAKAFEALRLTHFLSSNQGLPLLRYWFLNEVIADPDFAMNMAIKDEQPKREMLIQSTRRQIYGRCKGFLEVCPSRIWDDTGDGVVRFMHSTVQEFLDKPHIKLTIDHKVGHVDFFDRTCQTFLATLKYGCPTAYYTEMGDDIPRNSQFYKEISDIMKFEASRVLTNKETYQRPSNPRFSDFLDTLQAVAIKRYHVNDKLGNAVSFTIQFKSRPMTSTWVSINASQPPDLFIQMLTIRNLIPEFLKQKNLGPFIEQLRMGWSHTRMDIVSLLCGDTLSPLPLNPSPIESCNVYENMCRATQLLFTEGLTPNFTSFIWGGMTLFECYICYFLFSWCKQAVKPLGLLELCLRYGATSQLCLIFGPIYQEKGKVERVIKVGIDFAQDRTSQFEENYIYVHATVPIVSFALQRSGVLSLHDLFEFWFPDDYGRLHRLLDGGDLDAERLPTLNQGSDDQDHARVELHEPVFPTAKISPEPTDSYEIVENPRPGEVLADATLYSRRKFMSNK
ncbi:hypothetical protein HD806DRAFT_521180 [Xylariaceae sp. AK1471]|nr:hypothetical protein HD806DRAFT_521180 [Xylariaceae sp. AK1471]